MTQAASPPATEPVLPTGSRETPKLPGLPQITIHMAIGQFHSSA